MCWEKTLMVPMQAVISLPVFMTIFIQAFRLGAEPFFFNHAKEKNAKNTYALIMKYFVICGALMLLFIVGFIDVFKALIVRDEAYWVASRNCTNCVAC